MTWEASVKAAAAKLKEAYTIAKASGKGVFECSCCRRMMPTKMFSHVDGYIPRDPGVRKVLEGLGNIAAYIVCEECARLPEDTMLLKVEKTLVAKGLFRDDLKPLNAPGGHSPGHQKPHQHSPNCKHNHPFGDGRTDNDSTMLRNG